MYFNVIVLTLSASVAASLLPSWMSTKRNVITCPLNLPLSCSNTSAVSNSCCFEYPNGAVLQTQFWDYDPATGPADAFTLHGLWPDTCSGGYNQFCNPSWELSDLTSVASVLNSFGETTLLETMKTYWKNLGGDDASLWLHEFNKHGTCMGTLNPDCYASYTANENVRDFFKIAVATYQTLPTYQWLVAAGITPSTTKTYTKTAIEAALAAKYGHSVYISCDSHNALNQVWYFYHIQGSILNQQFVKIDSLNPSGCSATGIEFLPKVGAGTGSTSNPTNTLPTPSPTNSHTGLPTTGFVTLTNQPGCLISSGKWYSSGTCATYTTSASGSGYTLRTSKGYCAVDASGALSCAASITPSIFGYDAGIKALTFSGSASWSAAAVAQGSTQVVVHTGSADSVSFRLLFG